jgi:hypothetical protein
VPIDEGPATRVFSRQSRRSLILTRQTYAPSFFTTISGERVPRTGVPAAWSSRLGGYRAVNIRPIDDLVERSVRLVDFHGVLVLNSGWNPSETDVRRQVPEPASGSVAFTFGLAGSLSAEGEGDAVTAFRTPGGRNGFTYLGVRYLSTGP